MGYKLVVKHIMSCLLQLIMDEGRIVVCYMGSTLG
jgi:hypothetical protein